MIQLGTVLNCITFVVLIQIRTVPSCIISGCVCAKYVESLVY